MITFYQNWSENESKNPGNGWKITFEELFDIDFKKAHEQYKKNFFKKDHTTSEKELLVEMIFRMINLMNLLNL